MKVIVTHLMRFLAPRISPDADPRGGPLGGPEATRRVLAGAVTADAPHYAVRPLRDGEAFFLLEDLGMAGGPYHLGAVLELIDHSPYRSAWYPAEGFSYSRLVEREPPDGDRLWDACSSLAVDTVEEAVGHAVTVDNGWLSLPNRAWKRTLGVLTGCPPPRIALGERGYPICQFLEPRLGLVRSVITDVRFYRHMDGEIADHEVIEDVNRRLQSGVNFHIAIEIPPVFPQESPTAGVRVGGLHLRDDPCWGTGRAGGAVHVTRAWSGV